MRPSPLIMFGQHFMTYICCPSAFPFRWILSDEGEWAGRGRRVEEKLEGLASVAIVLCFGMTE